MLDVFQTVEELDEFKNCRNLPPIYTSNTSINFIQNCLFIENEIVDLASIKSHIFLKEDQTKIIEFEEGEIECNTLLIIRL